MFFMTSDLTGRDRIPRKYPSKVIHSLKYDIGDNVTPGTVLSVTSSICRTATGRADAEYDPDRALERVIEKHRK
jgi:hypothetical protein